MKGRRLPDSWDSSIPAMEPGDYIKIVGGAWFRDKQAKYPEKPLWIIKSPNGYSCFLNDQHTFTEHPDGTLTVAPSILISEKDKDGKVIKKLWHGHLTAGNWSS